MKQNKREEKEYKKKHTVFPISITYIILYVCVHFYGGYLGY